MAEPAAQHDPAEFEDFVSSLYLAMIRLGRPTVEDLLREGYPEADVQRAAKALVNRGLVSPVGPHSWDVLPPEVALPRLAATLEARARFTRASATELGVLWRRARGGDQADLGGFEVAGSVTEIVQGMHAARARAKEQFCALLDDSPASQQFLAETEEHQAAGVSGPETCVCVADLNLLEDTEALGVLERLSAAGASVSVAPQVSFGTVVADDVFAVIDLSHYAPDGAVSFVVRRSPVLHALSAHVAAVAKLATPLRTSVRDGESGTGLHPRDQRVLGLLATGATDQVIARHLGVSVRTVERRVRALTDSLGAATRFQAGVLACRRGWI